MPEFPQRVLDACLNFPQSFQQNFPHFPDVEALTWVLFALVLFVGESVANMATCFQHIVLIIGGRKDAKATAYAEMIIGEEEDTMRRKKSHMENASGDGM